MDSRLEKLIRIIVPVSIAPIAISCTIASYIHFDYEVDSSSALRESALIIEETTTDVTTEATTEESIKEATPEVTVGGLQPVEPLATQQEIELIALVVMAEAEGECEYGQRLVIDVILNRVDSEHFPNSINEVIYQSNQFTSMWNGRAKRCWAKPELCTLVEEELQARTDYDVIFFTAGGYGNYGTHMFQVQDHYFCKY